MKVLRQRKYLFVLLALLVVFAACKGESPTAPPPNTGGGNGGGNGTGTPPPTGATIALAVSNANPLVSSTSVITATVTQNGNPVPNGTAVEFNVTDPGTFTDTSLATTLRTTTNGVATATVTSASAGAVTVTANVNNVTAKTVITFKTQTTTPPPASTTPSITGISPTTGDPNGGQILTITGANFKAPVRVIFDFGNGVTKEAFVNPATITPTSVQVITPKADLGTAQTLAANITLINQAGTSNEATAASPTPFTYALAVLTPAVTTVSPDSGPIEGGTRITIFGTGFQQPVQVAFSKGGAPWVQMTVINVTLTQIVAVTPTARDVNPDGSGPLTGPVNLRVLNINSNKDVVLSAAFRYTPKIQITTVGPNEGPFTGGTRFTIDGIGFDDPVAVTTAGVAAQVVRVSGSEIIAITNGVQPTGCADVTGPIVVTNTNNGDSGTGPQWIFRVPKPVILNITNPSSLGGTTTITVLNAFGTPRFQIGGKTAQVTGSTFDPNTNTTTFTVIVPPTLILQTQACGGVSGVNFPVLTSFDVVYTSAQTQCTDTFTGGAQVQPPNAPAIALSPASGFTPFSATFVAGNPAAVPPTTDSVTPSAPQTVVLVNNGTAPLVINSITTTGSGCSQFTFGFPGPLPLTLNQCDPAVFNASYNGPNPPAKGSGVCSIVVDTNAGVKTLPVFGNTQ